MSDRELSARPNLEQYKKQAKDLAADCERGLNDALARIRQHHPRFHKTLASDTGTPKITRTDAQLVIAREHGFESWPKFASYLEMLAALRSVGSLNNPVAAFIELACAPRHTSHASGTLEQAEMILARYPHVAESNIYTAAILADEAAVRRFLTQNPAAATAKGGPYGWDALTYLCFSRYLRIDKTRAEAFTKTARALLDAGASARTGWIEMIDYPAPRPTWESALYGAAAIARHAELTRLLLERGADPNDEETPYHVPEDYDNTILNIVLESAKLNQTSLSWMILRKTDWHDEQGVRLLLEHGADPNAMTRFGDNALHHALRRDNRLSIIQALLDHGADATIRNGQDGRSAMALAAHRGRGDVLQLFEERGIELALDGVDRLIAACATGDRDAVQRIAAREPDLRSELQAYGGRLLAEFAGNGNVPGLRCLMELGVSVTALYREGDGYFDVAKDSTALHVAAWRARHSAVKELVERGAPVNAVDGRGRTALMLAVRACVDSYWKALRSPESAEVLLAARATVDGIELPTGYDELDHVFRRYMDDLPTAHGLIPGR